MNFSDYPLDSRLLKNVRDMGFEIPTPIQEAALPAALEGHDILGSAETGTGKTATYLLPILQRIVSATTHPPSPCTLVLVPTRELALQVAEHAMQLSRHLPVRIAAIFGGVPLAGQERTLRNGVDVIIATPGRLLDHMERRNITFTKLQFLVLDEADRMLDIGFLPDIRRIVKRLPRQRQTMLFSATMRSIFFLADEMTRHPVRIEVGKTMTPFTIQQSLFSTPENMKLQILEKLLQDESMESVLLFTRTKHRADRVLRHLIRARVNAAVIHGDRSQGQRIAALESFRRGETRVLVATDIAARGIDVEGISHVINYDMPMQAEDYVHRIGRTGRAQAIGEAYTLVTPSDEGMVRQIEYVLKKKIQRRRFDSLECPTMETIAPPRVHVRHFAPSRH